MVGERGLLCSASKALRAVAEATLSRYARLKPPSEVLILFSTDEKKPVFSDRFLQYGRRERIRTSDPLVPNQLRYQAALLADGGACYCYPRTASTAFYAFAVNRLESTRLPKINRLHVPFRRLLQRFSLTFSRCLTPVVSRVNAAIWRGITQTAQNGIE